MNALCNGGEYKDSCNHYQNYRHPAVACNPISGGDAEVHIVYDGHESSTHRVKVESGYIDGFPNPGYHQYTRYTGQVTTLDSDSSDSDIGYPDVASSGNGGGSGHPSVQTGAALVSVVWHHVESSSDKVKCAITRTSGSSYSIDTTESTYGPTTSASLRCVAVAVDEDARDNISVVWTDDSDIRYKYYLYESDGGNPPTYSWNLYTIANPWTDNGQTDDFVDISVYSPANPAGTYSHGVFQENMQKVYYTREP